MYVLVWRPSLASIIFISRGILGALVPWPHGGAIHMALAGVVSSGASVTRHDAHLRLGGCVM